MGLVVDAGNASGGATAADMLSIALYFGSATCLAGCHGPAGRFFVIAMSLALPLEHQVVGFVCDARHGERRFSAGENSVDGEERPRFGSFIWLETEWR